MQYCGILLTRHTLYQTPALQKKQAEYEDRGGNHDLFAHLMNSWVGYELVRVLLSFGLSPKLRYDLNNFSPDLFILFSYFEDKQQDSSKKEEADCVGVYLVRDTCILTRLDVYFMDFSNQRQ